MYATIIFPIMLLMRIGSELSEDIINSTLFGTLFGGIGGLIGFTGYYIAKSKARIFKIVSSITVLIISIAILVISLPSSKTDQEIIKQDWISHKLGDIEFESPKKLTLLNNEVPASINWFYKELSIYSDDNDERLTSFIKSKITVDTFKIEDAFSVTIDQMLKSAHENFENFELDVFNMDSNEISSMFSFTVNQQKMNGYGYMFKNDKKLESIWLIPLLKGFSKEYIEEFEAGIFVDY